MTIRSNKRPNSVVENIDKKIVYSLSRKEAAEDLIGAELSVNSPKLALDVYPVNFTAIFLQSGSKCSINQGMWSGNVLKNYVQTSKWKRSLSEGTLNSLESNLLSAVIELWFRNPNSHLESFGFQKSLLTLGQSDSGHSYVRRHAVNER